MPSTATLPRCRVNDTSVKSPIDPSLCHTPPCTLADACRCATPRLAWTTRNRILQPTCQRRVPGFRLAARAGTTDPGELRASRRSAHRHASSSLGPHCWWWHLTIWLRCDAPSSPTSTGPAGDPGDIDSRTVKSASLRVTEEGPKPTKPKGWRRLERRTRGFARSPFAAGAIDCLRQPTTPATSTPENHLGKGGLEKRKRRR